MAKRASRRSRGAKSNRAEGLPEGDARVQPWRWVLEVLDVKDRGIYGKPENTRMFGIPPEWGDFRAMGEEERVREWLKHERERQDTERARFLARKGRTPLGGWTNALDRCEGVLALLDAVSRGEKRVWIIPADEFARTALAKSSAEGRLAAEMERLLASLESRAGVTVWRTKPPPSWSLQARDVGVPARRPGACYHLVQLAVDAGDAAFDEAKALQGLDAVSHLRELGDTDGAILQSLGVGRLIERAGVRRFDRRAWQGLQQQKQRARGTATTRGKGKATERAVREEYKRRRSLRPNVPQREIVKDVAGALSMARRTVYRHAPLGVRDALDREARA